MTYLKIGPGGDFNGDGFIDDKDKQLDKLFNDWNDVSKFLHDHESTMSQEAKDGLKKTLKGIEDKMNELGFDFKGEAGNPDHIVDWDHSGGYNPVDQIIQTMLNSHKKLVEQIQLAKASGTPPWLIEAMEAHLAEITDQLKNEYKIDPYNLPTATA